MLLQNFAVCLYPPVRPINKKEMKCLVVNSWDRRQIVIGFHCKLLKLECIRKKSRKANYYSCFSAIRTFIVNSLKKI